MADFYDEVMRRRASDDPVDRAVSRIWDDVTDRRGWRQAADQFDEEIKVEILNTWDQLIRDSFAPLTKATQ